MPELHVETHFLNTEWSGKTTETDGHTGAGYGFHFSDLTYFFFFTVAAFSYRAAVVSSLQMSSLPPHATSCPFPALLREATRLRASAQTRLRTRGQGTGQTGVLSAPGWAS